MRHKLFVALLIVSILATCKNIKFLPPHVVWQLNAYTNWNLILLCTRILFRIPEWDQFLCVNSMGIWFAFKTAFCQGLDDNIRKKLKSLNFEMSPEQFGIANCVVHTLPMIGTSAHLIKRKTRISSVNVSYALILATWFAFRQNGKLDASENYVPHPWKMSWVSGVLSMMLCPQVINAVVDKKWKKLLMLALILHIPYCIVNKNPKIKNLYDFEFLIQESQSHFKKKNRVQRSKSENILST